MLLGMGFTKLVDEKNTTKEKPIEEKDERNIEESIKTPSQKHLI